MSRIVAAFVATFLLALVGTTAVGSPDQIAPKKMLGPGCCRL